MKDMTFLVWSDTHFGYQQRFAGEDLRWHVIEQMNRIFGWPYPDGIGGCVDEPAFAMHCGDVVDGSAEPEQAFFFWRHFQQHLAWKQYETLGNHDGSDVFMNHFLGKHGSRAYSFSAHGIHCMSIDMEYDRDEKGTVPEATLDFVRGDLAGVAAETPVILFTHASLGRITNTQDVLGAAGGGKVVLALAGHHHRPAVYRLGSIPCVDVGHCRDHPTDPEYGRSFTVVRVRDDEILAIPWRWDLCDWERGQRWANAVGQVAPSVAERFILRTAFGNEGQ
jgi:predicted phosphodiesterase